MVYKTARGHRKHRHQTRDQGDSKTHGVPHGQLPAKDTLVFLGQSDTSAMHWFITKIYCTKTRVFGVNGGGGGPFLFDLPLWLSEPRGSPSELPQLPACLTKCDFCSIFARFLLDVCPIFARILLRLLDFFTWIQEPSETSLCEIGTLRP